MTPLAMIGIALGGGLGAVVRYLATSNAHPHDVPVRILAINCIGSLLAGLTWSLILDDTLRLIVITGILGGLTTFSTFALETVQLTAARRARRALAIVAGSVALAPLAAAIGWMLGMLITRTL